MRKSFEPLRVTVLSAALSATFGVALADDAQLAKLTKPDSWLSIGVGNWSGDRPQQGIFDGMREQGAFGLFDAEVINRNDATGTWMSFSGRNLGLETREVRAEWLRQGDVGGFIEYSRIPREHPLRINSGLQGIGTANQVVTTVAPGTGSDVKLGTTRDLVNVGFYKRFMPGLDFKVSFKNEDKDGTRHWGRGGAPEFAVEPIDFTTQQLEAVLEYANDRLQLSGGYYGSWFHNANDSVLSTGASCSGNSPASNNCFLSVPQSNEAHQAFFNGGFNFTPTTRGTFKLAYTHATQDETFPQPVIVGVPFLATVPTHLDGKLDTTVAELGLSTRPVKNLSVIANLRYHDLSDKTPINRFVESNAACGSGQCVDNTPWSYETLTGKVEATYRLPLGYSVVGGIEQRYQDREFIVSNTNGAGGTDTQRVVPFRTDLDETTYRIEGRKAMSESINGSLAYAHSKRDGSEFTAAGAGPGGAPSDLINPIHISDRKRDKVRLSLNWTPVDRFSLQFVTDYADDDYGHDDVRRYGLRDGTAKNYSVDAHYEVANNWQLTAWYTRNETKAKQFNQRAATSGAALADLEDRLEDKGDSVGLGLRGRPMSKVDIGADLLWTRTKSKYQQDITVLGAGAVFPSSGGQTVAPLPDIENKLARLSLFAQYALQKNADVRVDFIHERWKTDDWSWMFSDGSDFVYGTTTDGTTVSVVPKSVSNFVGVRYIYKFQ